MFHRICIYGAGAVGGLLGARLAKCRIDVSVVARGATLVALRQSGLRLHSGGETTAAHVHAEEDPAALGAQDLVVVAVKAPALGAVAQRIGPLLGPHTVVLTAMNGVPWWFFDGFGGDCEGTQLRSVDPRGAIAAAIPVHHVIGCVVHLSSAVAEPGFIRHGVGNRLIIGEPHGAESDRLRALADLLREARFEVEVSR